MTGDRPVQVSYFSRSKHARAPWFRFFRILVLLLAVSTTSPGAAVGISPAPRPLPMNNYRAVAAFFSAADADDRTMVAGAQANALGMVGEHPMAVVWTRSGADGQEGGDWKLLQALTTDLQPFEEFASAVAVQGDFVALGAPGSMIGDQPRCGSVYLYRRSGEDGEFYEAQRLISPEPASDGRFGASAAFFGSYLAIGAPGEAGADESSVLSRGAVYIYGPGPTPDAPWRLLQRVTPETPEEARSYGASLAGTDEFLVIGDPDACQTESDPWRGRVHILAVDESSDPAAGPDFEESGLISLKDSGSGLRLGRMISASGSILALACEVMDPESTLPALILMLEVGRQDKLRVVHQQVLKLPEGSHPLRESQMSVTPEALAILTHDTGASRRNDLRIFAHNPEGEPRWATAAVVYPAHLPIFGENPVTLDRFTLFAGDRLLTVLRQATANRRGGDQDALTAVVSYAAPRLITWGRPGEAGAPAEAASADEDLPTGEPHSSGPPASAQAFVTPLTMAPVDMEEGIRRWKPTEQQRSDFLGTSLLEIPGAIVAGAPGGEEEGRQPGRVVILPRETGGALSDTGWQLRLTDERVVDLFGKNLAYHNGILAVSAPQHLGTTSAQPGAVALFRLVPGEEPVFLDLVTAPDTYETGGFAADIALADGLLFVGAPGAAATGAKPRVLVFQQPAGERERWEVNTALEDPDEQLDSEFGRHLALFGDLLVVGAPGGRNLSGQQSGTAWIYSRHRQGRDQYGLIQKLNPVQSGALARFGSAFAMSGDTLFVGAPEETVEAQQLSIGAVYNRNQGAVYEFTRDFPAIGNWGLTSRIIDKTGHRSQHFGESLQFDPATNWLWVGAPMTIVGDPASAGGAVVAFHRERLATLVEPGEWAQLGSIRSPEPVIHGRFGQDFLVSENALIAGALRTSESSLQPGGGLYVFADRVLDELIEKPVTTETPPPGSIADHEEDRSTTRKNTAADTPETASADSKGSAEDAGIIQAGTVTQMPGVTLDPWRARRLTDVPAPAQMAPLAGGLLLGGSVPGNAGELPMSLASLPVVTAEEPAPAPTPVWQLPGGSPEPAAAFATMGSWLVVGKPDAGVVDLTQVTWDEEDQPQISTRTISPRIQRPGFGRQFAMQDQLLALTDTAGVSLYRIIGGNRGAAIFESRLSLDQELQEPPLVAITDRLIAIVTTGTGSKGVPVAEVQIFPKAQLRFQQKDQESVLLPLSQAMPADALRIAVNGDAILVSNPAAAEAFVIKPAGTERADWKAAWKIRHQDSASRFGAQLAVTDQGFILGAPADHAGRGAIYLLSPQVPPAQMVTSLLAEAAVPQGFQGAGDLLAVQDNALHTLALRPEDQQMIILTRDLLGNLQNSPAAEQISVTTFQHQLISSRSGSPADARKSPTEDEPAAVVTGAAWQLFPVPGSGSDRFGESLCATGPHLFVGDPAAAGPDGQPQTGSVWYYRQQPTETGAPGWAAVGRLSDPDPVAEGFFGAALALQDDRLAAAAPGKNQVLIVQLKDDGSFQPLQTLAAPAQFGEDSRFGHQLAFAGDTLLISAPEAEVASEKGAKRAADGVVWVYRRSSPQSAYELAGPLPAPTSLAQDPDRAFFGSAIAVPNPDLLVIGAPLHINQINGRRGAVFVYQRDPAAQESGWRLIREFSADREIGSTGFGATLSAAGEFLAIGAPAADMIDVTRPGAVQAGQGAVHLYRKRGVLSDWIGLQVFTAQPGRRNARFGASLAIGPSATLAVSAPGTSPSKTETPAGVVFSFWKTDVLSSGWKQSPPLAPAQPGGIAQFARSILIHNNSLICTVQGEKSGIATYPIASGE